MDANGRIYNMAEDLIPEADKARLDGYLKGREEMGILADVKAAAYEAKVAEMETAERMRAIERLHGGPG